jgi:SNF2 family DNA or RNA helicase
LINQRAIDAFLKRKLNSYEWLKTLSHDQLNAELPAHLHSKLWLHQKTSFLLINELKRFIVHIGMGGGKTLLSLAVIQHLKNCGEKVKAIVFVPYLTAVETWVEEVAKHAPELKCVPLLGTSTENLAALDEPGDLFVVCYQTAVAALSTKNNGKWQLDAEVVRRRFASFNFLVCDEIHKCKSQKSLTYKMCRAISAQSEYVIGLTGTPFATDVSDLWPQFNLVDFGETLGPNITFFREAFFTKKKNYWGGYEYKFQQKKMPVLQRFIKNRSIHYSVDEFSDMPPKSYFVRSITLPPESLTYSESAMTELKTALKGGGDLRAVESSYLRLQQLGSGFMTLRGEDTERVQIQFDTNPKLDALEEILDAMDVNSKMVIFHHFVYTSGLLSERLRRMGWDHACINGSVHDPVAQLRRFKGDPNCKALVINCKSGSSSLNLQLAHYVVFFEQPTSSIDRQQAEARCWRPGQDKRVFIYDLLARGTMDHRQHAVNKTGENLLKCLLSGKVNI